MFENRLKEDLESYFSMPISVIRETSKEGEVCYVCYPFNEEEIYFKVSVRIRNQIRLVAEITPQRHAGDLIKNIASCSEGQRNTFFKYSEMLQSIGAKINFSVNGSNLTDKKEWPDNWKTFFASLVKLPINETENDSDEFEEIAYWTRHCFCWIFCLMTIDDVQPYENMTKTEHIDELIPPQTEGNKYQIIATRYERNPINRELCIAKKGYRCNICGFDYQETYGSIGYRYIQIHHVTPVSKLGPDYLIDIEKDLIPVCANCHVMIHRRNPPYRPDELIKLMKNK